MLSFIFWNSFGYANEYSALQKHLESIDKPKPGIEIFNTKTINHESYSGWVCTYKDQLEEAHTQFLSELKEQRAQYDRCNFSVYVTYLFDKKEFNSELIELIKQLSYTEISPYNYMTRKKKNMNIMTVSFICTNCEDSQSAIAKNINRFVHNTCQNDTPDQYTTEMVEFLKKKTNTFSRTNRKE